MKNEKIRNKTNKNSTGAMGNTKKSEKKITDSLKEFFKKIVNWAKNSKLNMSVLITSSVMVILILIVVIVIISRGGVDNKYQPTTVAEETPVSDDDDDETTMPTPAEDELFTTDIDEENRGTYVNNPSILSTKLTIKKSWISDNMYYTQYNVEIKNVSEKTINDWAVVLRTDNSFEISDNWNAQFDVNGNNLTILPFPDNEVISVGETVNVGFVAVSYRYIYFNEATVFRGSDVESYVVYVSQVQPTTVRDAETTTDEETTSVEETTTEEETTSEYETSTIEELTSEEETSTEIDETTSEEYTSNDETSGIEESSELETTSYQIETTESNIH